MPYFSVRHVPNMPLVLVDVTDLKPKVRGKDGFELFWCVEVFEGNLRGAELAIERLDERMGSRRRHRGVYQAKLEDVWAELSAILAEHAAQASAPLLTPMERVACGVAAAALLFVMTAIAVPATIAWMVVCAFRKQSGLHAMADTAILFSIFDWRALIHKLARMAYYGR
jgi:hypothetical protein